MEKVHFANTKTLEQAYRVLFREAVVLESAPVVALYEHYDGTDLDPVIYFPAAAIATLDTTESDLITHCPIKGDASYLNYGQVANGLWCYRTPLPGVSGIKDHFAFDQRQGFRVDLVS